MKDDLFEGSLLLERLAELELVDDFFQAVDLDDVREVVKILRFADISDETIAIVLKQMEDTE